MIRCLRGAYLFDQESGRVGRIVAVKTVLTGGKQHFPYVQPCGCAR
jgi:hypothetical protein